MIRVAVLGCGRIGQIHAQNVAQASGAELVAVADADEVSAAATAGRHGAQVRTVEAILSAADVDAVVICTPTDTHADLIERAAEAGKAIFCEKPIDLSIARVRACLSVLDRCKVPFLVGFNRRFDPNFAAAQRRIGAGEIGTLETLHITSRDPSPPPVSYIGRSGGLFRDMMIHDFDMARFLLGAEPVEVHAMASNLVDPAIGAAGDVDTAVVSLRTADGRLCQITNSRRATYGYDQRVEAHGSLGLIRVGNVTPTTVELANADGVRGDPLLPFFLERYAEAYKAEMAHFIAGLTEDRPLSPGAADGLSALALADAAALSLAEGRPVRVELG